MHNRSHTSPAPAPTAEPSKPWTAAVGELLSQAALLAVEHGLDLDAFMRGAWAAYLESINTRPELREELEEMSLREQLDEMRKAGRIPEA